VRRDGTEFPVEISLSPIDTEFGRLVASAIRDITDRRQAEIERERLVRERSAQVAANRLKDEFLATLSHELRTPLNVLIGEVWRLRSATLPPDRASRSWHAVERNLAVLRRLVEDLLDVSRGITGKLTLDLTPIDLASVVDDVLDVVKPTASAKGVELVQHAWTTQAVIMGDAARLQQVFWNLLSNAVKFTPRGGRVEVEVSRVETSVQVAVADTGIGIAPEFLPHVFDRFAQADSSLTRTHSGLGLGLAIVQQLVEQHGGSVRAYSTGADKGARFEVRLPVPAVLPHAVFGRQGSANLPRLDGVRVLLVDDQADAREAIAAVLAHFGADLRKAASADEALEAFAEFHPDVLLADIAMPVRDGYELIRAIRQQPDGAQLPAVALTAYAAPEDRVRAVSAGFQLHVAKPVQPIELAATVAHLFHSHGRPRH
jgi:signal transduction histidine kinase